MWEALAVEERAQLQWHFIITMARDCVSIDEELIHADTFDGTMVAFALMSNKLPTPIYPAAQFDGPNALQRFVQEASGVPGITRPPVHVPQGLTGPLRQARAASLVMLSPAVAHAVPAEAGLHAANSASVDSQGQPLASAADHRWFCRVSIELIPAAAQGVAAADAWAMWKHAAWPGNRLRERVALLVAEHVWDADAAFVAAARQQLGL
jgi:hypothetical protein